MASTPLGDIPAARFSFPSLASHASVASDGASSILGYIGPFPHDIKVSNFWWLPTGANQTGHGTSYRRISLVNGGADGAGTTVLASLNLSASKASMAPVAFTNAANPTLAAGAYLIASQTTVGGNKDDETELVAGQFSLAYEVI